MSPGRLAASSSEVPATWPNHGRFRLTLVWRPCAVGRHARRHHRSDDQRDGAFHGGEGWFLGTAASGATISAAKSLAVELAPIPIRVNVVAPGVIRSQLWSQLPEADREARYESVGRGLPGAGWRNSAGVPSRSW